MGYVSDLKATGTKKAKKGTRTAGVKDSVLEYLKKHGKATAKEIVTAMPHLKIGSVNQCLYGLEESKTVSKSAKRGSPYVLKK